MLHSISILVIATYKLFGLINSLTSIIYIYIITIPNIYKTKNLRPYVNTMNMSVGV